MLMNMLDWSRYTEAIHETDPRGFARYEMRPLVEIEALARQSNAPFFVIKSLCELDQLGGLMDRLAPAKTLWIVRDFDGSVCSALRSFGNFVEQLRRLAQDRNAGAWRGRGMSDATHALLRRLYHADISEASAAALMWYYRNVLFFERGLDHDSRVCLLFYEDMARQREVESARIFDFLGIPGWSPWICRKIASRSMKNKPCDGIAPEVREVCQGLLARFHAAKGR